MLFYSEPKKPDLTGITKYKVRLEGNFVDQNITAKGEQSAIILPLIELPFIIKIRVLSIFEWPLKGRSWVYKAE